MEMFAVDEAVAQWEVALLPLRGPARLQPLLRLAWHLRQRDPARAAGLADEARTLLAGADPALASASLARLDLVRGESLWLQGELDGALALADAAHATLHTLDDGAGCADAHWLRAWIAIDRGDHQRCDDELGLGLAAAQRAGDGLRAVVMEATMARWDVLRDARAAQQRWSERLQQLGAGAPPAAAAWISDFRGLSASLLSQFGAAASHYIQCYEAALRTGQVRAAITAATNIGEDFTNLNDHHAALEWMQCALDLARPTGWPRSVGACMMHTADTMRRLGRLDAAEELLQEALTILAPLSGARSYAVALLYLGELALDQGHYERALTTFRQLEQRADALQQADFQTVARRGQAHALCFLGQGEAALRTAQQAVALAAAQANAYHHIAALRVLSLIHTEHRLPAPDGMTEQNATLHYLHQALAVASTIDGYTLPGDLLDALAREYANVGNYAQAYESALAASAARDKTHSQEATNRAIAMQVHHQTEHARAEGQHHRELAASEARRAEVLQQTSDTLERLSAIGQEITTHLDTEAVFQALDRHVQALLPADTFAVYLTDPGGATLSRAFGVESGRPLDVNTVSLDHPHAHSVRSLRERREVVIDHAPSAGPSTHTPGTLESLSALFAPMLVGERALGVMTVQALRPCAYGERERLIFRTLCAYGAIAIDNAQAYRQLKDAQAQLLSQEKLAALGSLMAGVAHELNTPIGNSLLIASTLAQKTEELERRMNGPGLRRSDLGAYVTDAKKASELVMRGLNSAADLVNSFKQVAVDRTTEQRRTFNLHQVAHELIATMMNRIRASDHKIESEVPEHIALDSYPGPFGQVIANFINNALLHAFGRGQTGHMWLRAATPAEGRVLVTFGDNGNGIAPEHLSRIFDPFFTTKLGQGGSGLGLSISYNIVTSLLGGQISVASGADGTVFTLDLPLTAPQHDAASAQRIYH
ncbi:tetratricopeptide repeat-containing sensor histidine kinase [Duganella sp. FT3S]|uniref:histidine kinase n=1 Tax=Rugamonas fusca TaxID=2758568 RepID=A0A7W2EHX4_9BURK|nr:tetratricopeptide repeat-containing sensor histidine kinase [Rugamonas fusca]MBA5606226.1 tetratricopeptide repeat-containing sensor histidine kinase [Rugamonas fusca]